MNSSGEYNSRDYPPVFVTVDIVVFTILEKELQVVLVERGEEPFFGEWALPGGFLKPGEDLYAAAERELEEETHLRIEADHLEQFGVYSSPERDPRDRVVTVAYWAICSDLPDLVGGGDAARAELFLVSEIEQGKVKLAFDHREIVCDAVKRAHSSLDPLIAAKFCPPQFTISELRNVYEAVRNRPIDKGNFQRMIRANSGLLNVSAPRISEGPRGGRPASLWSLSEMDTLQSAGALRDAESGKSAGRKKKTRKKSSRKKPG